MAVASSPAVVLTREAPDNAALRELLVSRGVTVVELPCLATRYLTPEPPAGSFAAVVLTSRRGVVGLAGCPFARQLLGGPPPVVAAVGAATARALAEQGREADLVAEPPTGAALAAAVAHRLEPVSRPQARGPGPLCCLGRPRWSGGVSTSMAWCARFST